MPGQNLSFEIAPLNEILFPLTLAPQEFVQIRVEQLRGLAEVELAVPPNKPRVVRLHDTGKHGVIRISLVSEAGEHYFIHLRSYHKDEAAEGTISLTTPRVAEERDRQQAGAEELLAKAEWSRRKGDRASWPQALKDYDQVAATARDFNDVSLLRDALTGKARLLIFRLNDYSLARTVAKESASLPQDNDLPSQALAWKTLSSAYYYVADYRLSVEAAQKALAIYRQTDDSYWQGITLGNLAYMYREIGRTEEALVAAQQALDTALSLKDWFGVAFNQEALATIHLSRGELEQAFEIYHNALDTVHEHPYPAEEAATWNGLGELSLQVDDFDGAENAFRKALDVSHKANDKAGELKVLSNLGNLSLQEHNTNSALKYCQQGLKQAEALRLPRERSFLLGGLASALAARGDRKLALTNYRKAIEVASEIGQSDSQALALQGLGDLYSRMGQTTEAEYSYREAFNLWSKDADRAHAATALASLARMEFRQGRLESARKQIYDSLDLIESSRQTLTSRDFRSSYFASKHAYYDLAISILAHMNGTVSDTREESFELSERARARSLLDSLGHGGVVPAKFMSPELLAQQRENQQHLDAAYRRWRNLAGDPAATPDAFPQLRKEIDDLLRTADEIDARARAGSPQYAELTAPKPLRISPVQKELLDEHSALLSYWVGEGGSYMWLVRSNALFVQHLPPRAVLEPQVRAFRQALTARLQWPAGEDLAGRVARLEVADRQASQFAATLGRTLLPKRIRLSGIRTIYVVPDGPLLGVPFSALRPEGEPAALISVASVLQEPSASVLLSLTQSQFVVSKAKLSVAIFADPVYTADDSRFGVDQKKGKAAQTTTMNWAPEAHFMHLQRLTGSRAEALAVAALQSDAHPDLNLDFNASLLSIRTTRWEQYDVAHFAVHALLNSDRPEYSGVALSMFQADGTPQDGVLRLSDISALHMPVSLVVLSGCRTLEGKIVPGEGLVGLSQAFLTAGAHAVVGSWWNVEDERSSQFMREFYKNLLVNRMNGPEALRRAQLTLLHSSQWHDPYYWAAYAYEGAAANH